MKSQACAQLPFPRFRPFSVFERFLTWYHTLQITAISKISYLVFFHKCHHFSYLMLTSDISFSLYHCCFIIKQPHLFYLLVINLISFKNIAIYFFKILVSFLLLPMGAKYVVSLSLHLLLRSFSNPTSFMQIVKMGK